MTARSSRRLRAHEQGPTASRILDVSSRLFSQKGFSNVSIRDICKEAGTTAPVIYYHFGNKKRLFEAVASRGISMERFIEQLSSSLEDEDPKQGIRGFVSTYLESFPERAFDPGFYMKDSANLDETSAKIVTKDLEKVGSIAVELVRRCQRKGKFRRVPPELAADCLLGMLNRVIFQQIHFSKAADKKAYGSFVGDLFFRGMGLP